MKNWTQNFEFPYIFCSTLINFTEGLYSFHKFTQKNWIEFIYQLKLTQLSVLRKNLLLLKKVELSNTFIDNQGWKNLKFWCTIFVTKEIAKHTSLVWSIISAQPKLGDARWCTISCAPPMDVWCMFGAWHKRPPNFFTPDNGSKNIKKYE